MWLQSYVFTLYSNQIKKISLTYCYGLILRGIILHMAIKQPTMWVNRRFFCKLSLHECHGKYVWSDINKCSPAVAVTAGIAGANLISQGEVSLVVRVCVGGVGVRGSSACTTVNTRYILIRCHRGVWSARENLSRIPGRVWAEGGEQRERAVMREQGGAGGSGAGWREFAH